MRESKKIYAICPTCEKEFSFIPSRKQKYCSHPCFLNHPENKSKRRAAFSSFYKKG